MNMIAKKRVISTFFLLFFLFFSNSCAYLELLSTPTSIVSKGVVIWMEGKATKYYDYDSDVVYRAARRTAARLGMPIIRDDPPDNGAYYFVVGENNKFKVTVVPTQKRVCKLNIRINFWGDIELAELFYTTVDEELSTVEYNDAGIPGNTIGVEEIDNILKF